MTTSSKLQVPNPSQNLSPTLYTKNVSFEFKFRTFREFRELHKFRKGNSFFFALVGETLVQMDWCSESAAHSELYRNQVDFYK